MYLQSNLIPKIGKLHVQMGLQTEGNQQFKGKEIFHVFAQTMILKVLMVSIRKPFKISLVLTGLKSGIFASPLYVGAFVIISCKELIDCKLTKRNLCLPSFKFSYILLLIINV